jgi:hypothetical protein
VLDIFFANDTPSGQSIPNRAEVKDAKGVKIYFDPVSTALREETVRKLTAKVCADADALCARLDARETIVYHVAAHGAAAAAGRVGVVFFSFEVISLGLAGRPQRLATPFTGCRTSST